MADMTEKQKALQEAHGTPQEFSRAVWRACPEFLTWGEAEESARKYQQQWDEAA